MGSFFDSLVHWEPILSTIIVSRSNFFRDMIFVFLVIVILSLNSRNHAIRLSIGYKCCHFFKHDKTEEKKDVERVFKRTFFFYFS